jgi:predicted nucleotidyltransferase
VSQDVFERVQEIANNLAPHRWMLVGGLMVHAHAQLAGIQHARPTDDVDLVVEVRAGSYAEAAAVIQRLGYVPHESVDRHAPFHRFTRGREHVDLMGPEDKPVRFLGREVLAVPGSRSALNRTNAYETPGGVAIRIPDVESALSLKGAAFHLPGLNRVRHLQDAVTLLACLDKAQPDISKSMKKNIDNLISAMDNAEAWSFADPTNRRRAIRAIRAVQPAWEPPAFVLPRRPGRGPTTGDPKR